jgi:hypothetical protein
LIALDDVTEGSKANRQIELRPKRVVEHISAKQLDLARPRGDIQATTRLVEHSLAHVDAHDALTPQWAQHGHRGSRPAAEVDRIVEGPNVRRHRGQQGIRRSKRRSIKFRGE